MADGRGAVRQIGAALLLLILVSCGGSPSPSQLATATAVPTATPSVELTASAAATATPEPELSLPLPEQIDARTVTVSVEPQVAADDGGRIVVSVTNHSETRIVELVLRWDTALGETLFLAPFEPAEARIVDGGPPLVQPWTKWVQGPGEHGEPAGTTSLGWGPLDPGATLTIPIVVTRRAEGAVSFDLQILADEAILTTEGGDPAELRVSVP